MMNKLYIYKGRHSFVVLSDIHEQAEKKVTIRFLKISMAFKKNNC